MYISEFCSRVVMEEVQRTAAYDRNNKNDYTQRLWALAWQKVVEGYSDATYFTAEYFFEMFVYHENVRMLERHFPDEKVPPAPVCWGCNLMWRWGFNALAAHYGKYDKEFTPQEREQYELFYQRIVRSFGHTGLFILPLGAHQLTMERHYRDAQQADLPEQYVEDPGDAYNDDEYIEASKDIDDSLYDSEVTLSSANVLTVKGSRTKVIKVPAADVDNRFQGLDYDVPVRFKDLSQSAQEAVSHVYNGFIIDGSYW